MTASDLCCGGHKKALCGYLNKMMVMAGTCEKIEHIFNRDVLPAEMEDSGDSKDAFLWRVGAYSGVILYFFQSLEGLENDWNEFVLDAMKKKLGDEYDPYPEPADYIETAQAVLEAGGFVCSTDLQALTVHA